MRYKKSPGAFPACYLVSLIFLVVFNAGCSRNKSADPDSPIMPWSINNKLCGYSDSKGNTAIAPKYQSADPFYEGLACVAIGDDKVWKLGFINRQDEFVIEPGFDIRSEGIFRNGYAIVSEGDNYLIIDKQGNTMLEAEYITYDIYGKSETYQVKKHGEGGLFIYDRDIKPLHSKALEDFNVVYFNEELFPIRYHGSNNYIYVDPEFRQVFPKTFRWATYFIENRVAIVWDGRKYGLLNRQGEVTKWLKYDAVGGYSEGLISVGIKHSNGNYWGFMDLHGNEVIAPRFDNVSSFSEGICNVFLNGKRGYINKNGQIIGNLDFDHMGSLNSFDFKDGYAIVMVNKLLGTVNTNSETIIPIKYKRLQRQDNGLLLAQDTLYQFGFLNADGKEVIPLKYVSVENFKNGFSRVSIRNKKQELVTGYIDAEGNEYFRLR